MALLVNMALLLRRCDVSDDVDFSYQEDLDAAFGLNIRQGQNEGGVYVRHMLLLEKMPFWRGGVPALIIKQYDDKDETITVAEGLWLEEKK